MNLYMDRAIAKMRSPNEMEVICIDITNRCNLACSNCTRLLANQDGLWDMSLENFRLAVRSLREYPGMVAVIGGNPTMHRDFSSICEIIVEERPDKSKRGLWTNNAYKHTDLAVEVFGMFNLNAHGDPKGIESLRELFARAEGPSNLYEGNSEHAPLLTAIKDLYGEEEMWAKISTCDINQSWSAAIVENRGKLRAYFCEVAAAFDLARGTDNGIEVTNDWWRRPIQEFGEQIQAFCPGCGAAARLAPSKDIEELDTYTISNQDLVNRSLRRKRKVHLIDKDHAQSDNRRIVAYNEDVRRSGRSLDLKHEIVSRYQRGRIGLGRFGLKIPGVRNLVRTEPRK